MSAKNMEVDSYYEAVVEVKDVSKTFLVGSLRIEALRNISLELHAGEIIGLSGPSGAGKTTLLNLIAGLDRPTSGQIFVLSRRLNDLNEEDLATLRCYDIGYVFQDYNLVSTLTARENLELVWDLSGRVEGDVSSRATELLNRLGILERADNLPSQLSGGERQRLAFARALMNEPPIILADEPTGNLDEETTESIVELLKTLKDERKGIIVATHAAEVTSIATKLLTLRKGVLK